MFKMADEQTLSDSQLRQQLIQHGETPGPITATTRSVWIKKLRSLRAGESSPVKNTSPRNRGRPRRSTSHATPSGASKLAGFSSGEEDDLFPRPASTRSKDARKGRDDAKKGYNDSDVPDCGKKIKGDVSGRRSHDEHAPVLISDSDDLANNHRNNEIRWKSKDNDIRIDGSTSTSNKSKPCVNSTDSDRRSKNLQRTRRRFSPGQAEVLLMQDRVNQSKGSKEPKSRKVNVSYEDSEQDEELYVGFESSRDQFLDWLFQMPVLIVVGSVIACLIGVAVYIWSQPNMVPEITFQAPIDEIQKKVKVKEFLHCLHNHVKVVTGEADCGNGDSRYLPGSSLQTVANTCFEGQNMDGIDVMATISTGLQRAISSSQQPFKIEDLEGNQLTAVPESAAERNYKDIQIASNYPYKSQWCRVRQALYLILARLLMVLAVLGSAMVVYYSWKRRWMLDDQETREMFILVDHIIDALRKHHEASQHEKELPPYLPIPHVRDMLIPPLERKKKARVWKKAVEFLSSTDSRIRVETQRIAGEDYEVWRWIGVLTPNLKQRNESPNHLGPDLERGKYWQGPAFAKLEQVVRMPIVTPTPCLKIRCMHGGPTETQDDWDLKTRDALLEKCNVDGAKILHIFVDKTSNEGCVYVKCDSLDSAGKAFRSIYANWFDGRLLVVKFVTLKRYHQRFPEALNATAALEPSGRFPSSLEWFSEDTVD